MRRGKRYRQRQCRHLNPLGIYGEGIDVMGGRRGFCPDCGLVLDRLPKVVTVTDDNAPPCIPSRDGRGLVIDPIWEAFMKGQYR